MTDIPCPRTQDGPCPFCGLLPGDDCPLEEIPFAGPAIGATTTKGECSDGEVCEACQ